MMGGNIRFLVLGAFVCAGVSACTFDEGGLDPEARALTQPTAAGAGRLSIDSVPDRWQFTRSERAGMLQVANEADLAELDVDARLDARAAANIIAYRAGADGRLRTDDDQEFKTLDALDTVKFVGPRAFEKLLVYARALGYVPESD